MPCLGPTESELRGMEIADNKKKYGVAGTDLDIATRVACHLSKGESNKLTKAWIKEHDKLDNLRALAKATAKAEQAARDEIAQATAAILKKHGLKE